MSNKYAALFMDIQEARRFKEFKYMTWLDFKVGQLEAGDFLISGQKGHVLIERKSVSDLAGSIATQQLIKEVKAMCELRDKYPDLKLILLVEGSVRKFIRQRKWNVSNLMAELASNLVDWNLNIVWIQDTELTSPFILSIALELGPSKEHVGIYGTRPKRKLTSLSERQRFFLEGIHGIGGTTADKVLKETTTIMTLTEKIKRGEEIKSLNKPQRVELWEVLSRPYYGREADV